MPIKRIPTLVFFVVLWVSQFGLAQELPQIDESIFELKRSTIIQQKNEYGNYFVYVPSRQPERILYIVHGTPGKNETTIELAKKFIGRWTQYAKRNKLLLIAIEFNRDDFGSDFTTGFGSGGYRGLYGRKIGADQQLIEINNRFQPLCRIQDGRVLLYGHSAGGQYTIRFSVRHPDRIAAAVPSAPGRFAYPGDEARWPYGTRPVSFNIKWSNSVSTPVKVNPDPKTWLAAAKLPLSIVVGEKDVEPQPKRPGHVGETRVELAKHWVGKMNELGAESGEGGKLSVVVVPRIGHDSKALTSACQKEFSKLKWVEPDETQTFRTWTSKSGKFELDAIFVSQDETHVQLRDKNREVKSVPKSKLCVEDTTLLERNAIK